MLRLWGKIIEMAPGTLLRDLYIHERYNLTNCYWAKSIKDILTKLGLKDNWETSTIPRDERTKIWQTLSRRLINDQFWEENEKKRKEPETLKTFNKIRNCRKGTRLPFWKSMDRQGAIITTRLRSGSSDLAISTGRRAGRRVLVNRR